MVAIVDLIDRGHQRWFYKKMEWPVVSGQYSVGLKDSPVAVCTLSSLDLMREFGIREEIAILGKTFTENLGIEKMIRNITSNPSIRFLILCGIESPHRVGQSIISLKQHGVDDKGCIINSHGKLPLLKNVTHEEIQGFRQQVDIIDLIGEKQIDVVLAMVSKLRERSPGVFTDRSLPARSKETRALKKIRCRYRENRDYQSDPVGFFVIQIDIHAHEILTEHYSNAHELLRVLHGKNAREIYSTIIRNGWVTVLQHAAYLGRELGKAELALKHGWRYEQNKELMKS
jgi:tetrahydromethanopterin S-methyltransferase subunit A